MPKFVIAWAETRRYSLSVEAPSKQGAEEWWEGLSDSDREAMSELTEAPQELELVFPDSSEHPSAHSTT